MSSFLDNVLAAASNVDKMEAEGRKNPTQRPAAQRPPQRRQPVRDEGTYVSSPDELDEWLEEQEKNIYGPSTETAPSGYDANAEMERIKKLQDSGGAIPREYVQRSGMPRAIVESIINNPCIIDPSVIDDPRRAELDERLASKFGNNGTASPNTAYERARQLNEKLDESDKKPAKAAAVPQGGGGSPIDYTIVKAIVSTVLDEKLEALKKAILTESAARPSMPTLGDLKAVSLGDKVIFLDTQDNLYEYQLVRTGKNKRTKK